MVCEARVLANVCFGKNIISAKIAARIKRWADGINLGIYLAYLKYSEVATRPLDNM